VRVADMASCASMAPSAVLASEFKGAGLGGAGQQRLLLKGGADRRASPICSSDAP